MTKNWMDCLFVVIIIILKVPIDNHLEISHLVETKYCEFMCFNIQIDTIDTADNWLVDLRVDSQKTRKVRILQKNLSGQN